MVPLRKTLVLAVLGQEIAVPVDFHLIEVMERAFNKSADALIVDFADPSSIQRRRIADVLCDLLATRTEHRAKRSEVREHVLTAPSDAFFQWVAQLSTGLLFTLRHITGEQYERITGELAASKEKKSPLPPADSSPAPTM